MSTFKDVLCLLAIFFAYGITGRMDYDDAVMLEETQRTLQQPTQLGCPMAISSAFPEHQVQTQVPNSRHASEPSVIEPCPALIY